MAISSFHGKELHMLGLFSPPSPFLPPENENKIPKRGKKAPQFLIQFHKQNINSIQVPAWQQLRNNVHLSKHKHDRFHCDFSLPIMGNIYVVPAPFLRLSAWLQEAYTKLLIFAII